MGIRVAGSLDSPQLDFYSRPSLPEKEVMAYVLGGRAMIGSFARKRRMSPASSAAD